MPRTPTERKQADCSRRALLAEGERRLAEAAIDGDARREAMWLLTDVLDESRAQLYARTDRAATEEQARQFRAYLHRRAEGEPLAYVVGHADFFGLRVAVSPAVLIPRPETENVVEVALRCLTGARAPRVLDAGTGSGCIALALQAERPDAVVHACDVSADALALARRNAETLGLGLHLFHADLLSASFPDTILGKTAGRLDLLVSNPPYVPAAEADDLPEAVRAYEPDVALFSGDDPLRFYRALARHAPRLLAPGGYLVLETHAFHAGAVAALLHAGGLQDADVKHDTFGRERIAVARRSKANPDRGPETEQVA